MRILTLSNVPLEARLGSAYVILGYANGLRSLGHHVDLYGPEHLEWFKYLRRGKLLRMAWGMKFHAARFAAKAQYDVVELYGGQTCHAAHHLSGLRKKNFLVVAHSNGIEMHVGETMVRESVSDPPRRWEWLKRCLDLPMERAFSEVDGIVTVSGYDRDYAIRERLQPESRLKAIDNPLEASYLGLEFNLERKPIVGFIAPWYPRKGVKSIQEALPLVLRRHPKALVRLIGVGDNVRKEELFPADICHRIEVMPQGLPRELLKEQYRQMAVLMMPSPYESFGLVASEAMACGCVVVASKTGFPYSLVDGEEVIHMDRADGPSLEQGLDRILSDEMLRRKIAVNGWRRVQGLRWDRAAGELENTYLSWLGEVRRGNVSGRTSR